MTWRPVPFVGGAYTDDSLDYSAQECLNLIPEVGPDGARSPAMLRQRPGLFNCGTIGDGPHRGARECEGALLVVSGNALYHVKADRSWLDVGTIPGTGRCKIAHNSVGEALIVNGSDGYLYNYLTQTFAKVTDDSFLGACDVDYLGHMFVTIAASRRRMQHSALDDGATWSALSTYDAEADPDAMVGLVADHGQVLLLGRKTGEWFANEPLSATELFQNTRSTVPRGCIAPHSICRLDNTVFWLADDGAVYKLQGQTLPVRISPPSIDQAIARCTQHTAFAYIYEDRGHALYILTFQDGHTWGYDVATGLWIRLSSYGLDRLCLNTLFKWDGRWYGGSYNSGDVYTLDWDYAFDDGDPIIRKRRMPPAHAHGERRVHAGVQAHWAIRESAEPVVTDFWQAIVVTPAIDDVGLDDVVSHQYVQEGGIGAIAWVSTGTLPGGLTLNSSSGLLSGTVTDNPPYTWTIIATDSVDRSGSLLEEVPLADLQITGTLPGAASDAAYEERLQIVGGIPPYSNATIIAGALPTTGAVSVDGSELVFEWDAGQTPGVYTFTVQVEDSEATEATSEQAPELFTAYTVFIGQAGSTTDAVSVLDPDTDTIIDTLAAGSHLSYPVLTDDGLTLVGQGVLYPTKVLISTGVATTMTGASSSFTVMVNATHAFCLKFSPQKLYKVLLSDGSLVSTYTPSHACAGQMAWNADRSKLYLSRYSGVGGLTVLDVSAGTLTNYLYSGSPNFNTGRGLAVRLSDEHVFNTGKLASGSASYGVRHSDSVGTILGHLDLPEQVQNPCINPAGTELWVPNYNYATGKVYVLDITSATPVLTDTITVGDSPNGIAFSPDGLTAYVTNGGSDNVSKIDTATYTVTATVTTDDQPRGCAVLTS